LNETKPDGRFWPICRSSCFVQLAQYGIKHALIEAKRSVAHRTTIALNEDDAGRKQEGLTVRRKPLTANRSCGGKI
jgi:hypothetical protein